MWITPNDLRREIRASEYDLPDAEANEWINTAYLKIQAKIGRNNIIDTFIVEEDSDGNIVREFRLYFRPVIGVDEVYLEDNLVDSSNYTVDTNAGKITIDPSVDMDAGDTLTVYYTPEILKLWELKLSAFYVLQALAINTGSGTQDLKLDRYVEEITSIEDTVLSKPKVASYREHKVPRVGTWNWGARDRL